MRIDVLTTFPELFCASPGVGGVLGSSIPHRAIKAGVLRVYATNIREYADNKHDKTDDRPYGGGPGMVMTCQPLWDAVHAVEATDPTPARRILLTPQGTPLEQSIVEDLAHEPRLVLLAGHYEGIDERVIQKLEPMEVSIGDYILSSGELGALVLIDAIARLLPGVLGDAASAHQDSFSRVPDRNPDGGAIDHTLLRRWCEQLGISPQDRLLDCPHYTRPREWQGMVVPKELLSGDHDEVARWRLEQMVARTRQRRPDLLRGQRE